jgi:hypothetical protein
MPIPTPRARALVALGCAALLAPVAWLFLRNGAYPDFISFHEAARVWLAGGNPYAGGYPDPLFYPLPSVVLVAPLAGLPMPIAGAVFVAIGCGLLAYGMTRETWHGLLVMLSANMVMTLGLGQWSPLLTAAVLLPWLAPLRVLKPSIGLALTVGYPTWGAVAGGALLLAASLVVMPTWPAEWLANLRALGPHPPPVMLPGGVLILLALTRWRRPEARLVAAMACVPQIMFFADQLPLWLVPRTDRERHTLLVMGLAGLIAAVATDDQPTGLVFRAAPFVLASCYLPAVVMVLRRPNEGPLPEWMERWLAHPRVPAWVRGRAASETSGSRLLP